jgi:hypothetical protein
MPNAGNMTWGDWTFRWEVGDANKEGLVIKDARWKGTTVLYKGSLPVIRVKYRGNAGSLGAGCGPYRDRIHWGNIKLTAGQTTPVTARVFAGGQQLELAVFAEIGGYDIYQAWYFHTAGFIQPTLYSSGWSCPWDSQSELDHKHHPYWRLDFDVEGTANQVWSIRRKSNGTVLTTKHSNEANNWKLADDADLSWTINKPNSSKHILIRYPTNERHDPAGSPWFNFSSKDMAVRRYRGSEDVGWQFDWDEHLGYLRPATENVDGQDIVFWAVGHLTHLWSRSDEDRPHWHSTGPIIIARW